MQMTHIKFPGPGPRYRLTNHARFIAFILVTLLMIAAVVTVLGKRREEDDPKNTSIAVTPFVPPPTPEYTMPPIDVPEGKTLEKVLVVIDPGHGGSDSGTVSPYDDDFYEKEVTLDIALKVRDLLNESGIDAVMTRYSDIRLAETQREDLKLRAQLANELNATLFVSIHVNAYDLKLSGATKVNGMEIHYLDKQSIYDSFDSREFAEIMGKAIEAQNGINNRGIIKSDFSVLRNTEMPAVLVETAYITNREDNDRLKSDEFRAKTAMGIADGVKKALDALQAFEYEGDLYVFREADSQ